MEIRNYADGVDGHYCIGRPIKGDLVYWEYYNGDADGEWSAFVGEVFKDFETAVAKYEELELMNSSVVVKYIRPRTRYEIAREG